ncbi:MAG: NADH-quinone oxidoreductase subunit A [Candidatus Omnitrophica bacterium]|nr:NADH-quinone oxidoreductase subunit A [Candidatus Omnitrophota bacterium]MBI3010315.1 NADH-quinone oxidoreductase subunit A [Candidatus Omnitrophota bacterium]
MEYASILIFAAFASGVAVILLCANSLWGPKRPNLVKTQPFECGVPPISLPAGRLPVHFYVVAMLFVIFDVELVFLFPWAVLIRELGWFGLLEMLFFLVVVVAGFVYAWKKGALEFK